MRKKLGGNSSLSIDLRVRFWDVEEDPNLRIMGFGTWFTFRAMAITVDLGSPANVDTPLPSLHRPLPSSNHVFPPVSHPFGSLSIPVQYLNDPNFAMEACKSLIPSRLLDQAWDGANAFTPTIASARSRDRDSLRNWIGTGSSASENAVSLFTAAHDSRIQWDWFRGKHWFWSKCDERPRCDYIYCRPIRTAFDNI